MHLETKRLVLRPWGTDDAGELFKLASDPRIGPQAGWPSHTSLEESLETIHTVLNAPETYAITLRATQAPIGSASLKLGAQTDLTCRRDECELGYWIGTPFWGQGFMPEAAQELLRHAFDDLHMHRVWCAYFMGNTQSARVQEKLGFSAYQLREHVEIPALGEYRTRQIKVLDNTTWAAYGPSR